jgi:hypothetical protein
MESTSPTTSTPTPVKSRAVNDGKKGIRITAFVLDVMILTFFTFLVAAVVISSQTPSSSGTDTTSVSITTSESSLLDLITTLVLQIGVFLFLAIAAAARQKNLILISIVFALAGSTAFSFISDFKSLLGVVNNFQSSFLVGSYSLSSCLGDFCLIAASIFFAASALQDDGRKACHIALILILISFVFYLAALGFVIILASGADIWTAIFLSLMYFSAALTPLCYFFNIDGYCYSGKVFSREKK